MHCSYYTYQFYHGTFFFKINVFENYFADEFGKSVSVGNQDTETWISPSQDCSKLFNNTYGMTTTPFLSAIKDTGKDFW